MVLYYEVRKDLTINQSILVANNHDSLIRKSEPLGSIFTREKLHDQAWKSNIILGKNELLLPEGKQDIPVDREKLKEICNNTIGSKVTYTIGIKQQKLIREYRNSEGIQYTNIHVWNTVQMEFSYNGKTYALTDGCFGEENLRNIVKNGGKGANQYLLNSPYTGYFELQDKKVNLHLSNTPSSIVFHELVGHHIEERAQKGERVGPDNLFVKANSTMEYDDEGIPSFNGFLVENGYIATEITEREKGFNKDSNSGLYKAGPHGGKGETRCSELYIENGDDDLRDLQSMSEQTIYCKSFSGGEYNNGFGVFRVRDAFIKRGNEILKLIPFTFYINIHEFRNHLAGIGNDTTLTHSAMCTKNFISIPTINYAPSILLVDVPIIGG